MVLTLLEEYYKDKQMLEHYLISQHYANMQKGICKIDGHRLTN